ncbi:hypothetical protein CMO88_01895 [Candidatus Woesearchaeota archaeon]|nr:hypothetical protein [Candidatus Woesearchaeota archaeon]
MVVQALETNQKSEDLGELVLFGEQYFLSVAQALRAVGIPVTEYSLPEIVVGEKKTHQDYERENELREKQNESIDAFATRLKAFEESIETLTGDKFQELYDQTIGTFTEDESAELEAIGEKLDAQTAAVYDGKRVTLGPASNKKTVAHELGHALRHQTIGKFEHHKGYSSADALLISAVTEASDDEEEERIPPYIVEFVADLAPIIGESLRFDVPDGRKETIEDFEAAARYFGGGYLTRVDSLYAEMEEVLKQAQDYDLQPTDDSIENLFDITRQSVLKIADNLQEFGRHEPYLAILDEDDTTNIPNSLVNAAHCVDGLSQTIIRYIDTDRKSMPEKIQDVRESIQDTIDTFKSLKRSADLLTNIFSSLGVSLDSSPAYKLISMVINHSRERLSTEWSDIFFMPPSEIEEQYFNPLKDRLNGIVEVYEASKLQQPLPDSS